VTFAELYAAVRDQGGFDSTSTGSSQADIAGWINQAYTRLVVRSKWRKAQVVIATTVADQAEYTLPATVEDIEEGILVGTEPWSAVGQETLWRLKNGNATADGGVWAGDYDDAGNPQIELYPAPDEAGVEVSALAVLKPVPLAVDADTPIVPEDFHDAIVDGAISTGLRRINERIGEADSFEARFREEVEGLRRRGNSRLSTGPVQVQVGGYHF
jgi:hypothetical protein